jgi:hypothetical protein
MARYNIYKGVEKANANIKKYIAGATAAILMTGAMAVPAFAANNGGGYCVNSANGCQAAQEAGAQCGTGAGSGAFGAFGEHGDVAHDFRGGANGQQTGLNNSALCGNRQGNL